MAAPLPPAGALRPPAAALACVPGLAQGEVPLRCERLPDGTVNDSWRVASVAGEFVLRLDGAAWRRPGVDRARESALHGLAAAAGIAPRIVAQDRARGVLVCEYLAGNDFTPADMGDAAQLRRLGERLARLHALPAPSLPAFDPLALLDEYLGACTVADRADAAPLRAGLGRDAALLCAGQGTCIVHGDLVHTNVRAGASLWLLDWEYAQVADPAWDIGCVLAYYPQAAAHLPLMLAASGLGGAGERVRAAARLHAVLGWAWHRARGEAAAAPAGSPGDAPLVMPAAVPPA
jgi:aminoglycoside phosphotransferase (APT) family kinase protein